MAINSKNLRGVGIGGLVVTGVVFAASLVLAGGLYWAKLTRSMELQQLLGQAHAQHGAPAA